MDYISNVATQRFPIFLICSILHFHRINMMIIAILHHLVPFVLIEGNLFREHLLADMEVGHDFVASLHIFLGQLNKCVQIVLILSDFR